MIKVISAILILVSFTASIYYLFVGLIKPETLLVYKGAKIPNKGVQLWALVLGGSGVLLLFPPTFKLATILMILNSLFTITCLIIIRDWKGAFFEFLFLQIPVFLLWAEYPLSIIGKF